MGEQHSETAVLKRELAARAIRTMGPRSPYWNCTLCGAISQTPIEFTHKADCLLVDTPNPTTLVSEDRHKSYHSIELQHAKLLRLVQTLCEEDPNDLAADGGVTVLDAWRKEAREILGAA